MIFPVCVVIEGAGDQGKWVCGHIHLIHPLHQLVVVHGSGQQMLLSDGHQVPAGVILCRTLALPVPFRYMLEYGKEVFAWQVCLSPVWTFTLGHATASIKHDTVAHITLCLALHQKQTLSFIYQLDGINWYITGSLPPLHAVVGEVFWFVH